MLSDCQSFDVLKYEVFGAKVGDYPNKVIHQMIPWVFEQPMADETEALAGSTPKNDGDLLRAYF